MSEKETWRIIRDGARPGAENMAVDEAIARAVGRGDCPPTLRLYRWEPATVSLGYFQRTARAVDRDYLARHGLGLVRRPTGGRAVMHDRELTYSVALPDDHPLARGSVEQSYYRLSLCLVRGLTLLGARLSLSEPALHGRGETAACFDAPSRHELMAEGRKLVGSAQVRRWGALLQHGSILIDLDVERLAGSLGITAAVARRLAATRMSWLGRVLGYSPGPEEVAVAVEAGFAEALGAPLVPDGLTPEERRLADRLVAGKYGTDRWNLEGRGEEFEL
ncbi:MAG: biotin/lipoate A/B protein ligase family protein [Bacillota bacterium]